MGEVVLPVDQGARKYRSGAVVLPGLWVGLHGPLRLTRDLYYSKHRVQRRDSIVEPVDLFMIIVKLRAELVPARCFIF